MSLETVRSAAHRARALLARLAEPLTALERTTRAAEAHIDALAPSFAALEADPFDSVQSFATERLSAPTLDAPRARRVLEPAQPALRPASMPNAAAAPQEPRSSTLSAASQGGVSPAPRVLPVSPRAQTPLRQVDGAIGESVRSSNADKAYTLKLLSEINRMAEAVSAQQRTIADASERLAESERSTEQPERVSFGDVASAALQRTRAAELHSDNKREPVLPQPGPGATPAASSAGFAGAVLRPIRGRPVAVEAITTDSRSPTESLTAPTSPMVETAPLSAPHSAQRPRAVFYFDPLEARPTADDADDSLAERIGQVLREQARRQGVDLT